MLCNNIRTEVSIVANYGTHVVHCITKRTFFLHNGTWTVLGSYFAIGSITGYNFMLVGVNYVLARYKTDQ